MPASPFPLRDVVAILFLAVGTPLAAQDAENYLTQPLDPPAALESMHVPDGFVVDLVAAEPMVMDPVAFDFAPDGKLWVVEMADYPLGLDGKGKIGGRVRFLEDADGDGKYDRSTLFLEGLPYPNGIMPWRNGVLISCAPDILYAEDTNGDGKADVRRSLYSGFAQGNQQHRVNGFWWGLDNWIYVADGGGTIKSEQTAQRVEIGKRDLRIRPDQGLIEPVTGPSQFGRAQSDWGDWFGCANSEPSFHFAVLDRYLRRNKYLLSPSPKVQISTAPGAAPVFPRSKTVVRFNDLNKANRFTSACGISIYRDTLLGDAFLGNTFVSEPVHNLVHREVVAPRGPTFTSTRAPGEESAEFLASSDNWFRPTLTRTGPDGALWVADMYRLVIEHPEWIPKTWQQRLDVRAGHDRGRIYRVRPAKRPLREVPKFSELSGANLAALLESPNGTVRDLAQQRLVVQQDREAIEPLTQIARQSKSATARMQALCSLEGLSALTPELLAERLKDDHPGVRRHAIRLSEPFLNDTPALGATLLERLDDSGPQVQMQLAYTLGEWDDPRAGRALGKLALRAGNDAYLRTAVMSSALPQLDELIGTVLQPAGDQPPDAALIESLLSLATSAQNQRAIARLVTAVATPAGGKFAPWQTSALSGLLGVLDRRSTSLAQFQAKSDGDLKQALGQLDALFAAARQTAADESASLAYRQTAVRLLGRGPSDVVADIDRLAGLLVPQTPLELQREVVAAMGRLRRDEVPQRLLTGWKGYGPGLRDEILSVLFSRNNWLPQVLDAVEAKTVNAASIDAVHRDRLLNHRDAKLRQRAEKLLAVSSSDRQKVVEQHAAVLTTEGDVARGATLFQKKCGVCHKLGGKGHAIGPDLTALTDRSPRSLLVAMLDPNKAVEAQFVNYIAITADGLTFNGLLSAESGQSVTLLQAEGKSQQILRADLDELQSTGKSLMPEGLEKDLKPQDIADVIAYLGTIGPARKQFDGNEPAVVRPEALRGEFYLLAAQAEIYGDSLVFEKKYGNLGYWQSDNDRAIWTMDVDRPGEYLVSLDYAAAPAHAGQQVLVEIAGQRLSAKVASTGSWDAYGQLSLGRVKLTKGKHRVGVRGAARLTGPLLDLKSVRIRPN